MGRRRKVILALAAVILVLLGAFLASRDLRYALYSIVKAQNGDVEPFEIADGLWYVGSSDIAIYALKVAPHKVVLIDAGYGPSASRLISNLGKAGIAPADVRVLLNTHAHFDHAAGFATLKRALPKAELYASDGDRGLLVSGGVADPYFATRLLFRFDPIVPDKRFDDGEEIPSGRYRITAHATPGHTPGCTSWSFDLRVGTETKRVWLICSLTALPFQLAGRSGQATITNFRYTYDALRNLDCDMLLTPHAREMHMDQHRRALLAQRRNPQVVQKNPFLEERCAPFIASRRAKFERAAARY